MALTIFKAEKTMDRVPNVGKVKQLLLKLSVMVMVPDVSQSFGTLPMKINQSCKQKINFSYWDTRDEVNPTYSFYFKVGMFKVL